MTRALPPGAPAVGDRMDLMVEFHGLWNLPTALRLAHDFEAEGIRPYWIFGRSSRRS